MTQTLAIFFEAYRNLNSKKLFWIVLAISGLVVVAFAFTENNERGARIVFWQWNYEPISTHNLSRADFYKAIFASIGIPYWLAWPATLLALISTAGVFPDLITSGSIDLYVSKPISRLRLFLTQYVAALLFVTLQVAIFSLASFLLIGIRGGAWEPALFLAIPLIVCVFSYLFAVCVLLGVLTSSTVAALLLTLLFWFAIGLIGMTEQSLFAMIMLKKHGVDLTNPDAPPTHRDTSRPAPATPEEEESDNTLVAVHRIFHAVSTPLPKPGETAEMLARTLADMADLPATDDPRKRQARALQENMLEDMRNRSWSWVVGTSLIFETLVLAVAALIFCRRDY